MSDCIFCKIIQGDIPSAKLYETDKVFAFLDIAPMNEGHALVIPKYHSITILDLPGEYAQDVLIAQQKIAKALMDCLGATGFNCIQNNFPSSGQVVGHVHWHIIPRFDASEFPLWKQSQYDSLESMNALAEKIKATII